MTTEELNKLNEIADKMIEAIHNNGNASKLAYELAVETNKLVGGDGKCHIETKDGKNYYSGPMDTETFKRMMKDPDSVLVL